MQQKPAPRSSAEHLESSSIISRTSWCIVHREVPMSFTNWGQSSSIFKLSYFKFRRVRSGTEPVLLCKSVEHCALWYLTALGNCVNEH